MGRVAELGGELGEPPVAPHVVDDDRGALGGEGAGGRGADAAGRAGDEGDALARVLTGLRVVVGGDGHAVERVDAQLERVERDRQDRHVVERVPAPRLGLVEAGRRDDDELVVDPEAQREEVVRVAGVRQRGRVVRVDDVAGASGVRYIEFSTGDVKRSSSSASASRTTSTNGPPSSSRSYR